MHSGSIQRSKQEACFFGLKWYKKQRFFQINDAGMEYEEFIQFSQNGSGLVERRFGFGDGYRVRFATFVHNSFIRVNKPKMITEIMRPLNKQEPLLVVPEFTHTEFRYSENPQQYMEHKVIFCFAELCFQAVGCTVGYVQRKEKKNPQADMDYYQYCKQAMVLDTADYGLNALWMIQSPKQEKTAIGFSFSSHPIMSYLIDFEPEEKIDPKFMFNIVHGIKYGDDLGDLFKDFIIF